MQAAKSGHQLDRPPVEPHCTALHRLLISSCKTIGKTTLLEISVQTRQCFVHGTPHKNTLAFGQTRVCNTGASSAEKRERSSRCHSYGSQSSPSAPALRARSVAVQEKCDFDSMASTLDLYSTHQLALCRVVCRPCGPVDGPSSHARACCAQKVSSQTRGTRGSAQARLSLLSHPAHTNLETPFSNSQIGDWDNRNRKTTN